jgi:hypothetical protein
MRRPREMMKMFKRVLMATVMCGIVSAGAFAQKQDPKPPPKEEPPPRVKVDENKNPPPDKQRNDDKKKP